MPRPTFDAVFRGDGRAPSVRGFDDEVKHSAFRPMTRAEAEAFERAHPALSPWRVIGAQVVLGLVATAIAWLVAGPLAAVSALYGAAVVVVPGSLMARGVTSAFSSLSPVVSAFSMLAWAFAKIAASVAMLALASRIVPGVAWAALLASLVFCMQSYWFALLWRVPGA